MFDGDRSEVVEMLWLGRSRSAGVRLAEGQLPEMATKPGWKWSVSDDSKSAVTMSWNGWAIG